jgi:hypothetical protein
VAATEGNQRPASGRSVAADGQKFPTRHHRAREHERNRHPRTFVGRKGKTPKARKAEVVTGDELRWGSPLRNASVQMQAPER